MSTMNPSNPNPQASSSQGGASRAEQPLRDKVDEVRHQADEMGHRAKEAGAAVQQAAREQMEHLRGAAEEYYEMGRERSQELVGQVEDYIRREPLKALLMAAGAGALLGVVFLRR